MSMFMFIFTFMTMIMNVFMFMIIDMDTASVILKIVATTPVENVVDVFTRHVEEQCEMKTGGNSL
jgi:hypothetical protein